MEKIEMLEQQVDLLTKLIENQDEIIKNLQKQISLINDSGRLTNKRIDNVINILKILKDESTE